MEFSGEDFNNVAAGNIGAASSLNVSHGSRSVLKELNSNDTKMLSPLAAKSPSTHKISQSPHPQTPTSPTVFIAPPPPNVAAGSAVFDTNSYNNGADFVPGNLDKTHLVLINNSTGVAKRNKFVGLTEFDESNIPELPECLNPNIGEQLKLTFDEDLIPTLTASSNAQLNLPNKRDDATKTLQVISNETDTTVSSDNETYAECESFPDLTNTTATKDLGYGGNNTSLSAYVSALNSYNTTIDIGTSDEAKQLDETLENVADIGDEIFEATTKTDTEQSWQEMMSTRNENQLALPQSATFDGSDVEAMDVDMNESQELAYTTNATMEADRLHGAPAADMINEFKEIPEHNVATSSKVTLDAEGKNSAALSLANEIEPVSDIVALKDMSNHQKFVELSVANNSTFADNIAVDQFNQTKTMTVNNGMNLIQDNSVDSATDANPLMTQVLKELQTALHDSANPDEASPNELISSSVAVAPEHPGNLSEGELNSKKPSSSLATAANIGRKLNLTLEINTSFEPASNQQTLSHSPSFPLKPAMNSKHFPRSPDIPRPMIFLEKSDYSLEDVLILTPSKKGISTKVIQSNLNKTMDMSDPVTNMPPAMQSQLSICNRSATVDPKSINLNKTVDMSDPAIYMSQSPLSTSNRSDSDNPKKTSSLSSSSLNCTFDGANSLPSPTMTSSATELQTASADKRHTFNASATPANSQLENSLNSSRPNSRLTFNIAEHENVNPLPSPPLPSLVNDSQAISADKRRAFDASPTSNLQLENSLNSTRPNSRLTFNVAEYENDDLPSNKLPSLSNESQAVSADKRCTFNASPTPNSQLENSLNSTLSNSRLTFNVPETEEPVYNQSIEAMDVDSSMHAPSSQSSSPKRESPPSPRTSFSVTCSSSSACGGDLLSAKEQTKSNAKDEKDIFVEKFSPTVIEDIFKSPSLASFNRMGGASSGSSNDFATSSQMPDEFGDEDFQNNLILNPSDFDYLLTKGNSNVQVDRSSLLLRFDPLLGVPIPVNQPQQQLQQLQQILSNNNPSCLSPTLEEEEHHSDNSRSFLVDSGASAKPKVNPKQIAQGFVQSRPSLEISQEQAKPKKNARMSVDVIKDMKLENDCNKSIENSNTQSDDIQNNFKMDELEKKIKNEVLKTEDIEKKLKEAEQREEALIKRITEKDKTIAKMNGVIEAYEKAIAELISEKEQLIQNYEKQLTEVKADRDSNYHHLTSLETTFSDLHVKYEKSKEMTSQLKSSEESLLSEKKQNLENLRLQEQRYEKMKNHAMQQLEIANKKLESLTKEHAIESTKLKALLKKEEISRASINEQLQQKSRENAELVKICDELINGQGS